MPSSFRRDFWINRREHLSRIHVFGSVVFDKTYNGRERLFRYSKHSRCLFMRKWSSSWWWSNGCTWTIGSKSSCFRYEYKVEIRLNFNLDFDQSSNYCEAQNEKR